MRCDVCAHTFKHNQDFKTHRTRNVTKGKSNHNDGESEKLKKRTEMRDVLPQVRWGELEADNAWRFRYLVSIFEARGG